MNGALWSISLVHNQSVFLDYILNDGLKITLVVFWHQADLMDLWIKAKVAVDLHIDTTTTISDLYTT